ncbi:GNAT family N-acetyltransferase [Tenacibaculum aiptasiae]|uniref:GNAT family N-acetyltransferase n=1 Tax=Tenacibaculum aiptasiae TaxID=426481 RepID=A0A7J5AAI2_9FLAO|nr:GNAT family N-acetyltransferase [Tenacibaculum aiptasiae]KAB1154581.1 GNAT family N-acetyltransferase [Tenacibaculum aiptasiae]
MTVKNLSTTPFEKIIECFLLAFENYFVPMPKEEIYYQERWKAAKVDFEFSYGMFDGEKLVGFIIHAIDERNGTLIAFNTGTGVTPEYRGKKIIQSIYKHALIEFKTNNIQQSSLEVITENKKAIHLYKNIGFTTSKTYKCYRGQIKTDSSLEYELKETDLKNVNWNQLPNQSYYSWDNQKESITRGNYQFFQIMYNDIPESFFIINAEQNYLAQFDLLNDSNIGWERLFSGIKKLSETIKINNVDTRLSSKIIALNNIGLKNIIDQFEMNLKIDQPHP